MNLIERHPGHCRDPGGLLGSGSGRRWAHRGVRYQATAARMGRVRDRVRRRPQLGRCWRRSPSSARASAHCGPPRRPPRRGGFSWSPTQTATRDALCDTILARLEDAVVHVVVPRARFPPSLRDRRREPGAARGSREHAAHGRLAPAAGRSRSTGSVGSDKPLESMTDALGSFPATHVLLAMPPEEESYWLEDGLLTKARALTRIPVTQVVVPSRRPRAPNAMRWAPGQLSLRPAGQ